jgi:hypothetical protein
LDSEHENYPDLGNYSSHYQVVMNRETLKTYVSIQTYDSPGLCQEFYLSLSYTYPNLSNVEPLAVGDGGLLIWHNNGNGTCALCFTYETVLVWIDLMTDLYGNEPWDDDVLYTEVLMLLDAQSLKIGQTLHS